MLRQSRSLGYAHWPERTIPYDQSAGSLDHWDMRTGRNWPDQAWAAGESRSLGYAHWPEPSVQSLRLNTAPDHWDRCCNHGPSTSCLDHWDMRTGRNSSGRRTTSDSPSLGYAHWPEPRYRPWASSLDHWDMRTGRTRAKKALGLPESRSLMCRNQQPSFPGAACPSSLGYAALAGTWNGEGPGTRHVRSLGYAHAVDALRAVCDHWDMRTAVYALRQSTLSQIGMPAGTRMVHIASRSLGYRTGRNRTRPQASSHWRTGRN